MLSSGMTTPPFFIFPGNFTHSFIEEKLSFKVTESQDRMMWISFRLVEAGLFVSVVSVKVRNTETNRNKPKNLFLIFMKQTEKQPKQIAFRFVSV